MSALPFLNLACCRYLSRLEFHALGAYLRPYKAFFKLHRQFVGRLVVVIDVNPSRGFWTARLMKVFGHEGKCTCRYKTHGWIIYIMLFPVVCGTSCGSSWLRRNEFLKMTK
jgi:hypothetical protein